MVSTTEECTKNIPMTAKPTVSTKHNSAIKPLHKVSETLYVKHKTVVHGVDAAKENRKAIKTGNTLWSNISKQRIHKK